METSLRRFVNSCAKKWLQWLSLVEYWYNTSFHSTIDRAPFEALYGYHPRHFCQSDVQSGKEDNMDQWLQERKVVTALIRRHLNRAAVRMRHQTNKGRTERKFKVGDMVFVKFQPYIQTSVAPRANQKLSFKFFWPFPTV
jgi:hypothetical protein